VSFKHGDFHELVMEAPEVDVVTLDRVVCCDPDFRTMLGGAADHARRLVAFTYPRPRAATRAVIAFGNWLSRAFMKGFQAYVHSPEEMARVLEEHGMKRRFSGGTFILGGGGVRAMKVSVFCGTSVDGFIAREDGRLDFLPRAPSRTATRSSSRAWTRSSSAERRSTRCSPSPIGRTATSASWC
jgi:hypothetical protein